MMKRSKLADEQIPYALRQVDSGTAVADICRQMSISEATFYLWNKKYANLGSTEIRELRQLREENAKLKRLVADLDRSTSTSRWRSFGKNLRPMRKRELVE